MIQKLIGILLLILGIIYGIIILARARRDQNAFLAENGNLKAISLAELIIYIIATLGLSDFLMQTLLIKGMRLADDKKIPGTLVAASVTPGAVIACFLLQAKEPVGTATLLICSAAIIAGSMTGANIVKNLDGSRIRRIMGFLLIGSMAALILKMIVSETATGTITALPPGKLVFAAVFSFVWGMINMLGIPMKPAATAVFLLLGMSPVAVLTMVLVMGCAGPLGGAVKVYKNRAYHQKTTCCSVVSGSIGAVLGSVFALSVNALLLNILMLVMLAVAIISMFRPAADSK